MPLTIPPYEGQGWTDNSTPDLSAETLNAVDDGIAAATNGVNAIAAAVVNQIINDPEKIASIAVAYAQQQQINTINSNLTALSNKLILQPVSVSDVIDTSVASATGTLLASTSNIYGSVQLGALTVGSYGRIILNGLIKSPYRPKARIYQSGIVESSGRYYPASLQIENGNAVLVSSLDSGAQLSASFFSLSYPLQ